MMQGKESKTCPCDFGRKPYSLTSNNCGTFAKDVLEADSEVKKQTPVIIDPRPVSMVEEFQETFESVSYNKK